MFKKETYRSPKRPYVIIIIITIIICLVFLRSLHNWIFSTQFIFSRFRQRLFSLIYSWSEGKQKPFPSAIKTAVVFSLIKDPNLSQTEIAQRLSVDTEQWNQSAALEKETATLSQYRRYSCSEHVINFFTS